MKPTNFAFARAASLGEAAAILREANGGAKAVAGGQSLGPMLNLRLVQPTILVDITAIPELTRVEEDAGGVTVGPASPPPTSRMSGCASRSCPS